MRTFTLCLCFLFLVAALFASSDGFKKARVLRANVGVAIPPAPDSEKEAPDEHEVDKAKADAQTLFVFVKDENGLRIVAVPCGDHCRTMREKVMAHPDVEVKTEGQKIFIRTSEETLEGKRYRMKN